MIRPAVLGLTVGGVASAAYQQLGSMRDRRRYPPPGNLADIGGRWLHLWKAGEGEPNVVIVPALGAPAIEWVRVQRALADHVAVYLYDRAGLGWSDPTSCPRTASRSADELHQVLETTDIAPPYVLVGHSMGGYVARLYATRHPDRTAGMVLVDSSHEASSSASPNTRTTATGYCVKLPASRCGHSGSAAPSSTSASTTSSAGKPPGNAHPTWSKPESRWHSHPTSAKRSCGSCSASRPAPPRSGPRPGTSDSFPSP